MSSPVSIDGLGAHHTPGRRRRRRRLLVSALAALAVMSGLVVIPATTASALSIDCAYTPGLGDYAARNGIDCQVGTRGGFVSTAGPGGFSSAFMPGGAVAPGTMSSYCVNEAPSMPEELYARGTVTAESYS